MVITRGVQVRLSVTISSQIVENALITRIIQEFVRYAINLRAASRAEQHPLSALMLILIMVSILYRSMLLKRRLLLL